MFKKMVAILAHYRSLVILVILLAGSTSLLVYAQYRDLRAQRAQPVPLNPNSSGANTFGPSISGGRADTVKGGPSGMAGEVRPISIQLSEGQAQPRPVEPLPVATGEPLSAEETEQILARLPALEEQADDRQEFKLPADPIPPPRPGQTIQQSFPPAPEEIPPATVDTGPLEVLRFAPEGDLDIAPFISVTFSQPMVPLTTLDQLAVKDVPVQVEPALPGTWRWLGTRVLTFQYDSDQIDRLPKATEYRVTIPAGTKSQTGGTLAETVSWTFTTPPPKITRSYPSTSEPQGREPLFFIHFDQRINPAAVLETITVTAGGQKHNLTLVSAEEAQANEQIKALIENAVEGRWLVFKTQEPLPLDSEVVVQVGPGTPSAEGPLVTKEAQSYSFRTYAPLRVVEHGCSWGGGRCYPLNPFYIRFNNPIDSEVYQDAMLRIDPPLPGAYVNILGDTLSIQGQSKGQTTYTVILAPTLQDVFGQQLGSEVQLTFRVGPAEPMLMGTGQQFITLDPAAQKPEFSVYSMNYTSLDVKVYAVQPTDWPAYKTYLQNYQRSDVKAVVPGRKVLDQNQRIEAAGDVLTEFKVDLSPYMDGPYGHFIVIVSPPSSLLQRSADLYWQTVQAWVQVTQIGLDAFNDHSEMVLWATNLKDGAPLNGVTVTAHPGGQQAVTGADGVARIPIPDGASYLVAELGADRALLPRSSYYWGEDAWSSRVVLDTLRWYVFDDRHMYRPGEEVHLKGWLRAVGGKQTGDVGLVSDLTGVRYQISDALGNEIANGSVETNALGGFDFSFTLPEAMNLGNVQVFFTAEGNLSGYNGYQYYHTFEVQEFRRPEFEVTARNETTGPYFAGGSATVAVKAQYYAGGALPGAEVNWTVTTSPGHYAPPKWPDFTFGEWTPWWWFGRYSAEGFGPPGPDSTVETFSGQTDGAGEHYLNINFSQGEKPQPLSVIAQATVMDVNRQAWTGSTSLLVHPASLYVGIRSDRYFVERGTPIRVEVIVTDLDGNAISDRPVEVQAARLEWKYRSGQWNEEEADVQVCTVGSQAQPVTCTFDTPLGGTYRITAIVSDDQGRRNQSRFTRWVSGGEVPPAREVKQETANLIPDKETYQPGDVAQILVQSPFSPAEGLLTVNRSGLLYTERFQITDGTATLSIPILEEHIPNLYVQVDLNGAAPRVDDQGNPLPNAAPRPAYATGSLNLNIPPIQRALTLEVAPEQPALEPGGETILNVTVKDAAGQPVEGAELAVVVVDEAVLALSGYQMQDPLDVFYSTLWQDWSGVYGRASIVLADPQALAQNARDTAASRIALEQEKGAAGADMAFAAPQATMAVAEMPAAQMAADTASAAQSQPIRMRIDFNPLATFAPEVLTDANGQAHVEIRLPDNLTRYRIMVAAVEGGRRFGRGEANLTARLPLMVRPSAPRFLNFGDHFELPVVLQNQTDEPMNVDVAVRAVNLELTGPTGVRVSVPANDRVEVRFEAAAQMAGQARIQVAATTVTAGGESYADAATVDLPVYTPATTEAFATYGVIDEGAIAQPLETPVGVFPQYGGLEVSTSSTALQALTDAVLYLVSYPFDCSEQIASRVLAVAALRDVLTAFDAEGLPSPAEMEAAVQRDLELLHTIQNDDGGFPYWRRGQESIPFNTIHSAHAIYRAQSKGFSVPEGMQERALAYLRQIENYYPSYYNQQTRWTLSAYALYVRHLAGDRDPQKALNLIREAGLENLSLDAVGWLWPVLQDDAAASEQLAQIRRHVTNRAVETAGAANFTTQYDDQNYLLLGSDRRTDAILLDALIGDNPQHDLIPKVVNGLLAHRTRGRWMNTQENVFVLLALDRYFNTFEAQTPDFVARIWLGQTYAGGHEFRGRTTDRQATTIPMEYLVNPELGGGTIQNLILSKEGSGRLYYRLGLTYAPTNLRLDALDMGFIVRRVYEAVDDPDDVRLDDDGVWHIRAGARVRVRVTLVADNRRYHVALVDRLPAGLEIINPGLAVSGDLPRDPNQRERHSYWWWSRWYEHQNLRDERVEVFTTLLWDGVYEYTYVARATTPGTFVVPPAKAEEMYSPETFGRSAGDLVVIE